MADRTPQKAGDKRYCFELSSEELEQTNKRVRYADQMPQVRKTDCKQTTEDLQSDRQAYQWCVNTLWRNHSLCGKTRQWLEDRLNGPQASTADCFGNVTVLKGVDPTFACAFFASQPALTYDVLQKGMAKDPELHHQLEQLGMCSQLALKLPKVLKNKNIMSFFFTELVARAGDRFANWVGSTLLLPSGFFNWPELGVYAPIVANGTCKQVTHRPTGHVGDAPSTYNIETPFSVTKNWSDTDGCIVKDGVPIVLASWFPAGKGPNDVSILKGTVNLDAIIKRSTDAYTKSLSAVQSTPEKAIGAAASAEKRKETMKKARDALDTKLKALARSRAFEVS